MKLSPEASPAKKAVQGKTLILGLLVALAAVLGGLFWIGMSGGSAHVPRSKAGVGFRADETPAPVASAGDLAPAAWDGGAIAKTFADRHVRDELRRRILAGWAGDPAARDPEVVAAAKEGRFLPAPTGDGGGMDPTYIRSVVHDDFFPMAGKCYDELLARDKSARLHVAMSFTIVADEKLGGIVEDVGIVTDGGKGGGADEKMSTCLHESLSTLAFRPPPHGGTVTVTYPIDFSPDDPDQ